MKLLCTNIRYKDWGMFTAGKEYEVLRISPNKLMVEVINDEGVQTQVIYQASAYGNFELTGD